MPIYVHRHGLEEALLRCSTSAAFSAVFATIRLRSGSLAGPVLFHGVNDAQFLLSGDGGGEAPPSARPMLVGGVIAVVYWLSCRRAILDAARRAA
jgi:membrane protease YdiL (CAAX protease family)